MKNIFVGNLNYDSNETEVRSLFEQFGAVDRVSLITDRDTGRPRGFGFVEMPNDDEADTAIEQLNGQMLGGRALNVNEARPRGGASGFGGDDRGGGRPQRGRRGAADW